MYARLLVEKIPQVKNTPTDIPAFTLVEGKKKESTDMAISVLQDSNQQVIFKVEQKSSQKILLEMTWPELEENLKKIMISYFYENYSRIKKHLVFRRIYSYAQRDVNYFANGAVRAKKCGTFPCMNCGIILPEHAITIDHDNPQKGGELLALLKVFRACNLTMAGPTGVIGQTYADYAAKSFNDLVAAIMTPDLWPALQPGGASNTITYSKKQQTLNNCGALIYSVLLWSEDIKLVMKNCMNSLLNLKPLCLSCNASKGNEI